MYRTFAILTGLCAVSAQARADTDDSSDTEHVPRHGYVAAGPAFMVQHESLGVGLVAGGGARLPGAPIFLGATGAVATLGDGHGDGRLWLGTAFVEAEACARPWACLYAELALGWSTHRYRADLDGSSELRHGPLVLVGVGIDLVVAKPVRVRAGIDLTKQWTIAETATDTSARRRYGGSLSAALELGF